MPGLSFLFKKKFHPSRTDNQKRMFVAEQTASEKSQREAESAKEVQKEKEMQYYESMGSMEYRDPRTTGLKFMYAAPQSKDEEHGKKVKQMASIKDYEAKIDERTGEDEMVRKFKAKIAQSKLKSLGEAAGHGNQTTPYDVQPPDDKGHQQDGHAASRPKLASNLSALEKEVGKRRTELTHEQMSERFAVLKNAPVEGGYTKGMVVQHKPFNEQLRNVHCIRCGEWGHMSGERECPLRDYNPNDYARQLREDPMARMMDAPNSNSHSASSNTGPNRIGSSSGRAPSTSVSTSAGAGVGRQQRCTFLDENGESDPEAEFLSTLTRREKKLLLRRLQAIESGQPTSRTMDDDSDSSSSNSCSSDSSSDSEGDSGGSSDSSEGSHRHSHRSSKKSAKKRQHAHKRKRSRKEHSRKDHRQRKEARSEHRGQGEKRS